MTQTTYNAKLVIKNTDSCGYTTLVFEKVNYSSPEDQYIMCVKYPNWSQGAIVPGEEGFLTVRFVKAGEDTWFDGTQQVPYKYTDIQFMKFIPIKKTLECIEID